MWQVYAWIALISLDTKPCPLSNKLNLPWLRFTCSQLWTRREQMLQTTNQNHIRFMAISWWSRDLSPSCPHRREGGYTGVAKKIIGARQGAALTVVSVPWGSACGSPWSQAPVPKMQQQLQAICFEKQPILKLSHITKTFKVNFSNGEKLIFFCQKIYG